MKHLYLLLMACLCYVIPTNAQTKYWIGPSNGNWNNANNWSNTSGGAAGVDVPNGASYDVVLDQNALILVDLTVITLNSLTVTSNAKARLYTPATGTTMTLNSSSIAAPALKIDVGSTLEDSASTANTTFSTTFANNAQALVDGTWSFFGVTGAPFAGTAVGQMPGTGFSNLLTVNGTIKLANDFSGFLCSVPAYLKFESGSRFWVARNAGNIPVATWDADAAISITGITTAAPSFSAPVPSNIGHLSVNCPGMTSSVALALPPGLTINGNLEILGTNNQNLSLSATTVPAVNYTVMGYMEVGAGSYVTLGGSNLTRSYTWDLRGNFLQTGGTLNLMNNIGTVTNPVTFKIRGDVTQISGIFDCLNPTVSTSAELFVIELNGTTNQNIGFFSSPLDNPATQVVLRMNNSAGATLQSILQVGKLSWNSAAKGVITTSASNFLFVRNSNATDPLVFNSPSNSGYVDGPLRRAAASNTQYLSLPVGKGGVLRACEVKPAATTFSVYEAEYFNSGYATTTVTSPLTAISNQEYWNISKIAGSDAVIRLSLATAVPGAGATDTLVVAHFNGTSWTDARGTKLFPGNSTTGSIETTTMTSFSPFTFAYTLNSALPIYLLNFTARKDGSTAKINWTITDNSTPQQFEVLRSTNGSNFTAIGTVNGEENKLSYSFTDAALPAGTVYYRLRMIDIDGSAELTKIVVVMNGSRGVVISSMMPTIVTNRARLQIGSSEKTNVQFVVTDIQGRTAYRQVNGITAGNQEIWLNLATLPAGTYQVTGYLQNGERTSTIRFIKQ
ncbi:T9SS type A sorting domain-containing protein [Paraflavitalea sp. CAU 1676]|uniref:T9SS type A sorting domain-containing protein n=1 Tax=Paraflavitalea sp. CAU 1676 TaxID=3032598 RepID=UPI0023DB7B1C|nr:T9SS type A sorting domain-containing protein [Paraflavitalea sp. CAU 1676]MDF2193101.1 T9SS type A sorting domain-containing protein [Paraflavitalea sp. CAU 1676]